MNRKLRRAASRWLLGVLAVTATLSCHTRRPVTLDALRTGEHPARTELKLTYGKASVVLEDDWTLDYPWVIGRVDDSHGKVAGVLVDLKSKRYRYNLEDTSKIELLKLDRKRSWALGVGAGVAGAAVVYSIVVAIAAAALLGSVSCPTVFVADAVSPPRMVGEAWPGAVAPSEEREDWLALAALADPSRIRIVVENRHREIQHVRSIGLAFVPHPAGDFVLATPNGGPVVVAELRPPRSASAAGDDVAELVTLADERFWQSSQSRISDRGSEAIEAIFDAGSGKQALIVRFENTIYSGAMLALRLDEACGQVQPAKAGGARHPCAEWRVREGFDAQVEIDDAAGSRTVTLGSAGVDGARTVALPLGELRGEVRVRLMGGSGFLRVDQLALAGLVDAKPEIDRFEPTAAVLQRSGGSAKPLPEAASSALLEATGDRLELEFRPAPPGRSGSWFMVGTGHYELQQSAEQELALLRQSYRAAMR